MAEKAALKRIINKDIKEIANQNLNSHGIYVQFDEENMLKVRAMIVGPKDSLYEGGFLFFNIKFPKNYPFSPPDVAYVSRNNIRIHPNIYVGHHSSGLGKVCLSILGTWSGPKWTTIMDITTVLLCIQSLLDSNPFQHEPGQEKNKSPQVLLYNEVIQYDSINTLLMKNYIDTPHGFNIFHEDMKEVLNNNKEIILNKIENLKEKNNKKREVVVGFYKIKTIIDYEGLFHRYKELFSI